MAIASEFGKHLDFDGFLGVFAKFGVRTQCIGSYVEGSRSGPLDYIKQNSTAGGKSISKTSCCKLVLPRAALPPQGDNQGHDVPGSVWCRESIVMWNKSN